MQTNFTPAQLTDPANAASEQIIRKCVHCGFCTATCPTYVLLGDERDSPRGRIYMIKDMLENARTPTPDVVRHVDRCLSCLSCMTTCPSGVNYMHLIDHGRSYIARHYERSRPERWLRALLQAVLPYGDRFRWALKRARLGRPLRSLFARHDALKPLATLLDLAPPVLPPAAPAPVDTPAAAPRRGRVALAQGCVDSTLRPDSRAATIRLLNRLGFDVLFAPSEGCCGALEQHMGADDKALTAVRRNVDAWHTLMAKGGLDAIAITASGCGTMVKDYGYLLRDDPAYADKAAAVSALAKDISEVIDPAQLAPNTALPALDVAYHAACSLQHGQKITAAPKNLLAAAGFRVLEPAEAHLCCGSAGTYNIFQPEIATRLRDRKLGHIAALRPDVIAAGNIGCLTQLAGGTATPTVHLVELLDWATGGPRPKGLATVG